MPSNRGRQLRNSPQLFAMNVFKGVSSPIKHPAVNGLSTAMETGNGQLAVSQGEGSDFRGQGCVVQREERSYNPQENELPSDSSVETKKQRAHRKSRRRPPYSYIALIAMAIENSSERRLTLDGICKFIRERFTFYGDTYPSWKICIRNNLSLNDCFIKTGIKSEEPLKGNYWTLDPESYNMFENGSFLRRKTRFKRQQPTRKLEAKPFPCVVDGERHAFSTRMDLRNRFSAASSLVPPHVGFSSLEPPKLSGISPFGLPFHYYASPSSADSLFVHSQLPPFLPYYHNINCSQCNSRTFHQYLRL